MSFKCSICEEDLFDITESIKHLKQVHKIRENIDEIKCIKGCSKKYSTYSGLRYHLRQCDYIPPPKINIFENNLSASSAWNEFTNSENDQCQENNMTDEEISFYFADDNHLNDSLNDTHDLIDFVDDSSTFSDELSLFLKKFIVDIIGFGLEYETTDKIFKLIVSLVKKVNSVNVKLINSHEHADVSILLESSMNYVCEKLDELNSCYKRRKRNQIDPLYIPPEERAVGTRVELRREFGNSAALPKIIQNTFQYIPITETLKRLFRIDNFSRTFFEYNSDHGNKTKHICRPNVYKDFCCGRVFSSIDLFKTNPNAIQIQIYTDDFEILPIKSKANVHKITAIYFTIRNIPYEFANRMENIYLVELLNSNDLKTQQTDFNNAWELIVHDIKLLETVGIELDDGAIIKGLYVFTN